jgi:OFA family oxalate/formate antiporter-like MFS transporter
LALVALQALAFAAMHALHDFVWLLIPIATVALCYGGGFGTMPAFVADIFGAKNSGTVYGAMLTAWSAGAIAGPLLIAALPYRTALLLIGGLLIAAMPLPLMFHTLVRRAEPGIAIGSPVPVRYRKHDSTEGTIPPSRDS